jgi:hypothetical protein
MGLVSYRFSIEILGNPRHNLKSEEILAFDLSNLIANFYCEISTLLAHNQLIRFNKALFKNCSVREA